MTAIAIYVTICFAASLHGKPTEMCRLMQPRPDINHFRSLSGCGIAAQSLLSDWLVELASTGQRPSRIKDPYCGEEPKP